MLSAGRLPNWVVFMRSSANLFSSVKTESLELVVQMTVGVGIVGAMGQQRARSSGWDSALLNGVPGGK